MCLSEQLCFCFLTDYTDFTEGIRLLGLGKGAKKICGHRLYPFNPRSCFLADSTDFTEVVRLLGLGKGAKKICGHRLYPFNPRSCFLTDSTDCTEKYRYTGFHPFAGGIDLVRVFRVK